MEEGTQQGKEGLIVWNVCEFPANCCPHLGLKGGFLKSLGNVGFEWRKVLFSGELTAYKISVKFSYFN